MNDKVELFMLKAAALKAELNAQTATLGYSSTKSSLERETDGLIEPYLGQVSSELIALSDRMSEFYRLFYILEIEMRRFVTDVMEQIDPDWWDTKVPQQVNENARKAREREENEGLAPRSDEMIDYTTLGELGEIIRHNWADFQGLLSGASKNRVLRVINRLNLARGPIAHCGSLEEDDIVRLKLSIRDWYKLFD